MPTIRARRSSRVRDAIAAGGVVLRQRDGAREVVLTGRHADGTWVFPRRTPLYERHAELGAKMVPFAGYEMPIQYEGIVAEHRAVRGRAGLFDLSHMGEFFFKGRGAGATLDRLVSSDIAGLAVGQARYGLLTNERGTIVDDVIVYRISEGEYMVVVNAANVAKDRAHVLARLGEDVAFDDRSFGTALVAIQGPLAVDVLAAQTDADVGSLPSFGGTHGRVAGTRATP